MQIAVSLSSWWMFQDINVGGFFQLNKEVPFPHFGWMTIVCITVGLLFKCTKTNLRTVNWKIISNLSFLSPRTFHDSDRRTETKPWNQALNHGRPGPSTSWADWREPPPMLQLRLGTHLAEKVSWQQRKAWPWGSEWCPGQWSRMTGSPPASMLFPEGESPKSPSSSLCGPRALSTAFPCSSPAHHLLLEAAVHTPPTPGLALRPQWSRLQLPELLSRARMSRKSGFLDTGLMLEERSARQNWWGLKIA